MHATRWHVTSRHARHALTTLARHVRRGVNGGLNREAQMKTNSKGRVDLIAEIETQRASIKKIRKRAGDLRERLKADETLLAGMETELATLEAAWAVIERKHGKAPKPQLPTPNQETSTQTSLREVLDQVRREQESVPFMAETFLREGHRPLKISQLYEQVIKRQRQAGTPIATRDGMSGALYRLAKKGKTFQKLGPGLIGLKEWEGAS